MFYDRTDGCPEARVVLCAEVSPDWEDLKRIMGGMGCGVATTESLTECHTRLVQQPPNMVLLSGRLLLDEFEQGALLLEHVRRSPIIVVYLMDSDSASLEGRLEKLLPPDDYLTAPLHPSTVARRLGGILRLQSAEQSLRRSRKLWYTVFQASTDALVLVNESGMIQDANPSAQAFLGIGDEPTGCLDISEQLSGGLPGTGVEPFDQESLQLGKTWEGKIIVGRHAGTPVEITTSPFEIDKGLTILVTVRDIQRHKELEAELRRQSQVDELTDLLNRRGFMTHARRRLRQASKAGLDVLLVYTDLDGLKIINDTYGHDAGDTAIRAAARVLQQAFRRSDVLGRLGGDEFAAVTDSSSTRIRQDLKRRVENAVRQFNLTGGERFELSISLGFASYASNRSESLDSLLKRADYELYQNKRSRKSAEQLVLWDSLVPFREGSDD